MINYMDKGEGLLQHLSSLGVFIYWLDDNIQCVLPENMTVEDVNTIIQEHNPWPSEKAKKLIEINEWLENQIQLVLSGIPKSEQASWPTQVAEARGIQPVSMLVGIARRRGISVEELKTKVLVKEKMFSDYYSDMQGERDRVETLVKAFPDEGQYELLPDLWALQCTV